MAYLPVYYDMEDMETIHKCKQRDINAFKLVYDKYSSSLIRTATRILNDTQDAEDAVQQTFLKLFKSIDQFSFKSKFSTYLYKILINSCYDILRARKKKDTLPLDDSILETESHSELKLSLEQAIHRLPTQMKACFVLFAVEGFKQREIAKILSLSIGGVKSNIHHAKTHLRKGLHAFKEEVI